MKKTFLISILLSIVIIGCKKEEEEKKDPIIGKWNYITYAYFSSSDNLYLENPQKEGYSMYFVFNEDKTYYLIKSKSSLTATVGTYDIYDNILMLTYNGIYSAITTAYTFHITDNTMELSSQNGRYGTATSILEKVE